jgi:hypothetical protein
LTEVGREAATLTLILTGAWLSGQNRRQRFAFFLAIFAIWDIFYYFWLKALINWPVSIMDWDILFLIPLAWASPCIAPALVSFILLVFAVVILYWDSYDKSVKVTLLDWLGFIAAALIVVVSFCIAGLHMQEPDFHRYFYWPLFAAGLILAAALFLKCLLKSK